jgi:hypothetical protein
MKPKNPINTVAKTMEEYPNRRFLEKIAKISEKIPNAGNIRIYTSGCPKIQKKCSQIIVFPPLATSKKFEPNKRSKIIKNRPIVNGGNANKINAEVTKLVHVNNGIRI